jgi:hypothetical protein
MALLLSIAIVAYGIAAPWPGDDNLAPGSLEVRVSAQSAITGQLLGKPDLRQSESSRQNQPHSLLPDLTSNFQLFEWRHSGIFLDRRCEDGGVGESGSVRAPPSFGILV